MESFTSWLSGENAPSERSNGAWQLVEKATNEYMMSPDWGSNLEVCDFGNASPVHAEAVVECLQKRVRAKKPKVVSLTLELIRGCAKNGNNSLLGAMGGQGKQLMMTVANLLKRGPTSTLFGARSNDWLSVEQEALSLIQDLGQFFQQNTTLCPEFYRVYANLVRQGVIFPIETDSLPPTPPVDSTSTSMTVDSASVSRTSKQPKQLGPRTIRPEELEKLEQDVTMLSCKIDVADHLLEDVSIQLDSEDILDILDFLLQCKPRMVDLIDASARGLLGDQFLAETLKVNDRLCAVVERLEGREPRLLPKIPKVETIGAPVIPLLKAPTHKSSPREGGKKQLVDDFEEVDLLGDPFSAYEFETTAPSKRVPEPALAKVPVPAPDPPIKVNSDGPWPRTLNMGSTNPVPLDEEVDDDLFGRSVDKEGDYNPFEIFARENQSVESSPFIQRAKEKPDCEEKEDLLS